MMVANDYLFKNDCYLAPDTLTELRTRYKRQAAQFKHLYEAGKISTNDPNHLDYEDIREYFIFLRDERKLKPSGIKHEITALNTLCRFCNNHCVEYSKVQYPKLVSKVYEGYLPSFNDDQYNLILNKASAYSEYRYMSLRAYAMVVLSLCGGLRRKEVKYAKTAYLDLNDQSLFLERVKGEGSYGSSRVVAIRPSAIPILERYLFSIKINDFHPSDYLFFNIKTGEPLSDSAIDQIRAYVSRDIGFRVTFQECRRSYGQSAVDDGLDLDYLSPLMGHSSIATTEKFYARTKPARALKEAKKVFNEKEIEKRGCVF